MSAAARTAAAAKLDEIGERFAEVADPLGREQWVQALVDLGFAGPDLLEALAEPDANLRTVLAKAVRSFRAEWLAAFPSRSSASPQSPGVAYLCSADGVPGELSNFEREALIELVSFEGRVQAPCLPSAGEQGLWSRVLHYRLAAYNLYSGPIAAPVGEDTRRALLLLGSILRVAADERETFQLLGNAAGLCNIFLSRHGDQPLVVQLGESSERAYADLLCDLNGFGSLRSSLARLGLAGRVLERQRLLALQAARPSPSDQQSKLANWFGLVLVQQRLWMLGYYPGRVDSLFGPKSCAALNDALRDMHDSNPHFERQHAIVGIGAGRSALNPRFVLDQLCNVLLAPQPLQSQQFVQLLEPLEKDEPPVAATAAPAAAERSGFWSRVAAALKRAAQAVYKAGRRIYHAVRSVVVRTADVLRQGLEALYYGLQEVAARVRNVFRVVLSHLEHAVRTVSEAFSALAAYCSGAPILTSDAQRDELVYSRVSADADSTLLVQRGTGAEQQRVHCLRRSAWAMALNRALAAIGLVLHYVVLVLTQGIVGLARLAFDVGERVVRSFRRRPAYG